jgi:hypothetical protein
MMGRRRDAIATKAAPRRRLHDGGIHIQPLPSAVLIGMKSSLIFVVAFAAGVTALIGAIGKIRTLLWRAESRFGAAVQAEAECA